MNKFDSFRPRDEIILSPGNKERIDDVVNSLVFILGGVGGYAATATIPGFLAGGALCVVVKLTAQNTIVKWARLRETDGECEFSDNQFPDGD